MRVYTYSEARQNLSSLLDSAENEEVIIKRRDGRVFAVNLTSLPSSPFDVPGIKTKASSQDMMDAIAHSRSGER